MTYERITSERDKDIPYLNTILEMPQISRYISVDKENFWRYVTETENVFYYKVVDEGALVGAIQLELAGEVLYMDIMVIPEFQRRGIGTAIIRDIQNGVLPLSFARIEISIDESNIASIRLFEKMGFRLTSRDDELLLYAYTRRPVWKN
ncbi:MAG: GNAT family N-acetyltransferase [Clostridia bacterium]|nr:GNAT family N-acetyltransferase [Clostridia bacterium]